MPVEYVTVRRGGKDCVLYACGILPADGVLLPCADNEEPTRFTPDETLTTNTRHHGIRMRRAAARAVKRTMILEASIRGTMVDAHQTVARLLKAEGEWELLQWRQKPVVRKTYEIRPEKCGSSYLRHCLSGPNSNSEPARGRASLIEDEDDMPTPELPNSKPSPTGCSEPCSQPKT